MPTPNVRSTVPELAEELSSTERNNASSTAGILWFVTMPVWNPIAQNNPLLQKDQQSYLNVHESGKILLRSR